MKKASKNRRRKREPEPQGPVSVVTREGKTTVRQFEGRRLVRFGEMRGKKVAWVELFTAGGDGHSLSVHFLDQTVFDCEITPMFTVRPKYYAIRTGDPQTIKQWPQIKSER